MIPWSSNVNMYGNHGLSGLWFLFSALWLKQASPLRWKQKPAPFQGRVSIYAFAVRAGFEPAVRFPVRQFSKLVVSASHPPHQRLNIIDSQTLVTLWFLWIFVKGAANIRAQATLFKKLWLKFRRALKCTIYFVTKLSGLLNFPGVCHEYLVMLYRYSVLP